LVLKAVVENVRAAGIVVVVSAGNSGPACSTISEVPAFYDASFSIGATSLSDTIASFSSRGPVTVDGSNRVKPDLSAPGVGVRVARPPAAYNASFSGTSGSAPHVTGAVALLWSAAPQLIGHVDATTSLLERTAAPLTSTEDCGGFSGASVPNPVFGWGRLDVAAAVTASLPPPSRPKAVLTPRRGGTHRLSPRS
jgi:subtilisin family serine protease